MKRVQTEGRVLLFYLVRRDVGHGRRFKHRTCLQRIGELLAVARSGMPRRTARCRFRSRCGGWRLIWCCYGWGYMMCAYWTRCHVWNHGTRRNLYLDMQGTWEDSIVCTLYCPPRRPDFWNSRFQLLLYRRGNVTVSTAVMTMTSPRALPPPSNSIRVSSLGPSHIGKRASNLSLGWAIRPLSTHPLLSRLRTAPTSKQT